MSEEKNIESMENIGARKAISETLLELLEKSEEWLSQRAGWDTRGAYLTMVFCLIGGLILIVGAYISHT